MRKPSDEKDFLPDVKEMLILTETFSMLDEPFRNQL